MAQYPEIDYRHVLSELSVNRKDPCEVIRELISNSYDAQASRIEIYPLLKDKGFIYFDNGTGLSEKTEINGITPYRAFFSIGRSTKIQGELIGYKCQGSKLCFASNGESHYIFMINGSFDVVTNRNSLTETALRILQDDSFIEKIKQFFDEAMRKLNVFRELIERLNKDNQDAKLDAYTKKLNKLKEGIQDRPRFKVEDIEQLKGKWLVEPGIGEEYWVGALYTMFAHLVTAESDYAHLWLCPRTFSSMGIDSIAVSIGENSLAAKVHKALEYKYNLSASDEFNHPLILTDQIVCWEMPTPKEGAQIEDSYKYYGYISLPEELNGIGYEIIKIESRTGDFHGGNIKVISLKNLLNKTFTCQWETPPTKATDSKKGKGGKKSK